MNNNTKQQYTKQQVINRYLPKQTQAGQHAQQFAPSNIALCKYWGKRDVALNLPVNSSLSVSLGGLGTQTSLTPASTSADEVWLNDEILPASSSFASKVVAFLNLFRRDLQQPVCVKTHNNIPTAAGLASSASGFAALMLAINEFYGFNLDTPTLSAFARMGSGSAARSVYTGFVAWHKGSQADGMDSFAEPLSATWQDLRIGLLKVATGTKAVGSGAGMQRTVETAPLYAAWEAQATQDMQQITDAILQKDIHALGKTAEQNALSMHATMIASWPPLLYWQPASVAAMQRVWQLRSTGVPVYFTMDAGANLKLLFTADHTATVRAAFSEMTNADVVAPFECG